MRTKEAKNLTPEEREARKAARKAAAEAKKVNPTPTQQRVLDALKAAGPGATFPEILGWISHAGKPINKFHARGLLKVLEARGFVKRTLAKTVYDVVPRD